MLVKPLVYKDKQFAPGARVDFERESLKIVENFKVKELSIKEDRIDDFMLFLSSITNDNATPCLVEAIQKITREDVLSKKPVYVELSYREKITWNDLASQIEAKQRWGLELLEILMFLFLFPDVHQHSQVLTFNAGVSHGVSTLGSLGIRSFSFGPGRRLFFYTCFLKNEVFKNVFVPTTRFIPPVPGRK